MFKEENIDLDKVLQARREEVVKTIETISIEKLKVLGQELFPFLDHPWREAYFNFIEENSGGAFFHAKTADGIEVIYCPAKEKGIWYMPKRGLGLLQAPGLKIMQEITAKNH